MIIDDRGKLFGKVSIIDIIIVAVILAAVGGLSYKFSKSRTINPFFKGDSIIVEFSGLEVPDFAVKTIKPGDLVKDAIKGTIFGKVKDIKIDKAIVYVTTDKGEVVTSSKEGFSSVYLTVEGTGVYKDGVTDSGVSFDNTDYYIASSTQLKVGNTIFWTSITAFRKNE